jgi:serine phosphatase RsbU (regulator of sigma subunit)
VQRLLLDHHHASAAELIGVLEADIASFTGDTPAFDDIALLLLKRDA